MNTFSTRCPIVKRQPEQFFQWVDVGGERQKLSFEKEVVWIQQSESQLLYRHGDKVLQEGSTYTDFYGYLTSLKLDNPTPIEQAAYYGISTESSLELIVMTTVFMKAAIENKGHVLNNYKVELTEIPRDWRKEELVDGHYLYPELGCVLLTSEVTWSSKNTEQQNSKLLADFIKKWNLE